MNKVRCLLGLPTRSTIQIQLEDAKIPVGVDIDDIDPEDIIVVVKMKNGKTIWQGPPSEIWKDA